MYEINGQHPLSRVNQVLKITWTLTLGKKKTKAIEGKIVNSKLHINLLTHRIQLKESKRIKAWELKNCTFTHSYRIQLRESECIEPTS